MKSIILLLLSVILCGAAAISVQKAEVGVPHFLDADMSEPLLQSLNGQKAVVWKNPNSEDYYVQTYLIPSWDEFERDLKKICDVKNPPATAELSINVQLDSTEVKVEVQRYLNEVRGKSLDIGNIHDFNFATLVITTGGQDSKDDVPTKVRHTLPEGVEDKPVDAILGMNTQSFGTQKVKMRDSCDQLRKILKWKDLQGQAFVVWDKVRANTMTLFQKEFVSHKAFQDLLIKEGQTGTKGTTQQFSSGGAGINVQGFLAVGESQSSGGLEEYDTRRRAVSASLIDQATSTAFSQLQIKYYSAGQGSFTPAQMLDNLRTSVKARFEEVSAQFVENAKNQWALKSGTESRIFDKSEIDDLRKASSKPELKATSQQEVEATVAKVTGKLKDKKDITVTDEQKIEWHWRGKEWIPTNVKLYETSYRQFSQQAIASFADVKAELQTALQMYSLQKIDFPRASYLQNYAAGKTEGLSLAYGPRKRRITLPPKLHIVNPSKVPNQFVTCDDPAKASQLSLQLSKDPKGAALVFPAFLKEIGCRELKPAAAPFGPVPPPECAKDCFVRQTTCLVSNNWLNWHRWHMQVVGTGGLPTADGCGQPLAGMPVPPTGMFIRSKDDLWWLPPPGAVQGGMPPFNPE
jgi:hypothetical protein